MRHPPVDVMLTQHEVLVLTSLLGCGPLLGMEPSEPTDAPKEQIKTGLIGAERSLCARDLARIDADGSLKVRADVLNAVAVCAVAPIVWVLTRVGNIAEGVGDIERMAVYVTDDRAVAHTLQQAGVYRFVSLDGSAEAYDVVAEAVLPSMIQRRAPAEVIIASAVQLGQARTSAKCGDIDGALAALGSQADGQRALCRFLATRYDFVEAHRIVNSGARVEMSAFTVVCDNVEAWLQVEAADKRLHVQPVAHADVRVLVAAWSALTQQQDR
jgi:hypothetical protein